MAAGVNLVVFVVQNELQTGFFEFKINVDRFFELAPQSGKQRIAPQTEIKKMRRQLMRAINFDVRIRIFLLLTGERFKKNNAATEAHRFADRPEPARRR